MTARGWDAGSTPTRRDACHMCVLVGVAAGIDRGDSGVAHGITSMLVALAVVRAQWVLGWTTRL